MAQVLCMPSEPKTVPCSQFKESLGGYVEETEYVETSLRELRLRTGIALQTRSVTPGSPRDEGQFLAAVDGKGVMVTHEGRITMEVGLEYIVSGFTGQHDFHFSAPVIQVFDVPFKYALLATPGSVKARRVRRAARMKISLPATVSLLEKVGVVSVMLVDISVLGAMFHSPSPVGAVGDVVILGMSFPFEKETVSLQIPSAICYSNKNESGGVNVGVSFKEIPINDKALLHCLTETATN